MGATGSFFTGNVLSGCGTNKLGVVRLQLPPFSGIEGIKRYNDEVAMGKFKEGDRVKIGERGVTADDRKGNKYFAHMANLTGTVGNAYSDGQVAIQVDKDSLSPITLAVHDEAVRRMREKFLENLSEEAKKMLTPEELNFSAHFVHLVQEADLVKG